MSNVEKSGSHRQQYLIGVVTGSTLSLAAIRDMLNADPQTHVRGSGPSDNPTRLTAILSPEQTELLRARYGSELIVEKDAPLQPQNLL